MALDVKQGVALIVVLPQECCRHLARVHRLPNRGGSGVMEEVGHPGEGQEEDPGPHRRDLHSEGERPKGVGRH